MLHISFQFLTKYLALTIESFWRRTKFFLSHDEILNACPHPSYVSPLPCSTTYWLVPSCITLTIGTVQMPLFHESNPRKVFHVTSWAFRSWPGYWTIWISGWCTRYSNPLCTNLAMQVQVSKKSIKKHIKAATWENFHFCRVNCWTEILNTNCMHNKLYSII